MQYVVFYYWLLSFSIMSSRFYPCCGIKVLHVFSLPNNILLYGWTYHIYLHIQQVIDIWVHSTIWLLRIMLLCTFVYRFFCGHMF